MKSFMITCGVLWLGLLCCLFYQTDKIAQLQRDKAKLAERVEFDKKTQTDLTFCRSETQAAKTEAMLAKVVAADFQGAALEMVVASCGHMKNYHPEVFSDWKDTCNEATKTARGVKR